MISRIRPLSRRKDPSRQQTDQNSLFGEILDWMLAPLFVMWPISIAVVYQVATNIANEPYDQALSDNVKAISRQVKVGDRGVSLNLPSPARDLLHADEQDTVYYQILGLHGELVVGDQEIPWVHPPDGVRPETVYLRDDEIHSEGVRVAWQYLQTKPTADSPLVMVQVAETLNKRSGLSNRIVRGVLLPQFAAIPIVVILVYVGLGQGIAPLHRLQRLIHRRRPSDLSPIPMQGLPEEVGPVIVAFNDLMERLEQNLQAQQRFISNAAHQMRTPLTGLKMQADLALTETDPEQVRKSTRQMAESTDRLAHLINQLLSLARAEASSEKIHAVEVVDLEILLREVTRQMAPRAMAKRIDFGYEPTGWPLLIDGSPVLLRELFNNLIDNAIKYTPEGGRVTVRTRATKFAIVEVEDNGIGIPEEERELVFERFHRVLGSGEEGSGLGLAIAREIAELHRAHVLLRPNQNGLGTLANVFFRRSRASASVVKAPALPAPGERVSTG